VTATAALCGWAVAAVATALALAVRHALDDGREAVARACHELRGPLTAARLGLSLQLRFDEGSHDRLRAIDTELSRAALALDDLSVAQRGESTGPRLTAIERVDVELLVADAVEAARGHAHAAGVGLWLAEPSRGAQAAGVGLWPAEPSLGPIRSAGGGAVWGDRLRLAQALGNLIANAIEHGGAAVRVTVATRGRTVRVEICDDGPGLPAPVAALARRPRRGRGTRGRGLAIALAIAHRHGGTITAATARAGARVVLELPAVAGPPRDEP
jgi:signal transduction histidine kinase